MFPQQKASKIKRQAPIACTMLILALVLLAPLFCLSGCGSAEEGDPELTKNTYLELVDWHISGFWVINSPVVWVRVANYNREPISEVTFQYNTFGYEGEPLDQGVYTCEGTIPGGTVKNFIEQYVGLVHLHSDKIMVKLLSVKHG